MLKINHKLYVQTLRLAGLKLAGLSELGLVAFVELGINGYYSEIED